MFRINTHFGYFPPLKKAKWPVTIKLRLRVNLLRLKFVCNEDDNIGWRIYMVTSRLLYVIYCAHLRYRSCSPPLPCGWPQPSQSFCGCFLRRRLASESSESSDPELSEELSPKALFLWKIQHFLDLFFPICSLSTTDSFQVTLCCGLGSRTRWSTGMLCVLVGGGTVEDDDSRIALRKKIKEISRHSFLSQGLRSLSMFSKNHTILIKSKCHFLSVIGSVCRHINDLSCY
eukprot:GEMP01059872.1.p1 GENE.GEMP01059872.1~~GEMP01059872.1.p1  ORF type:complete len:230 (-),score=1.07 GEMP01059872.1:70-759(-)